MNQNSPTFQPIPNDLMEKIIEEKCFSNFNRKYDVENRKAKYLIALEFQDTQKRYLAVIPEKTFGIFSCDRYCTDYTIMHSNVQGNYEPQPYVKLANRCAMLLSELAFTVFGEEK